MTVYIDVLIVMNIYISYFILRAVSRMLHTDIPFRRIAAASVFGGMSSLAALCDFGPILSLAVRTLFTVIMVLIAFGTGKAGQTAVRSFLCLCAGMLVCGAAGLIHELTGSALVFAANGYAYIGVSALVLVISSAVIYGIMTLIRRITDSPAADGKIILTIEEHGRKADISAFPDSGNLLRDFLTGRPVILCRKSAVESVIPPGIRSYLDGNTDDIAGIRIIPLRTAAGTSVAAAFRPGCVTARYGDTEKRLDALIAVSDVALENESFDAVISPKLLV